LAPLVVALTVALTSSTALAGWYEGYVPMQQDAVAMNVGSGYTGNETVSENGQFSSDVPLAEDHVVLMPPTMDVPLALDKPYQMGSGYTSLDQSAAVIIIFASTTMEGGQTSSADEQSTSGAAE
jgi:hypothetical protein